MARINETFTDEARDGRGMIEDLISYMEELANSGSPGQRKTLGKVIASLGEAQDAMNDALQALKGM